MHKEKLLRNRFFLYSIIFFSGFLINVAFVLLNTSYKFLSWWMFIIFGVTFLYAIIQVLFKNYTYP